MILRDALLAWAHFLCIFALVSVVFAELVLYRRQMDALRLAQLQRVDLAYGIAAALVVVSGVSRVIWGLKGPGFYLHNPIFWTKMALFLIVGICSIPPTVHYLRVQRTASPDGSVMVAGNAFGLMRGLLAAEAIVLVFIPLCATLLAHGYH